MDCHFPESIFGPAPQPGQAFDEWLRGHGHKRIIFAPEEINDMLVNSSGRAVCTILSRSKEQDGAFHATPGMISNYSLHGDIAIDEIVGVELYVRIKPH